MRGEDAGEKDQAKTMSLGGGVDGGHLHEGRTMRRRMSRGQEDVIAGGGTSGERRHRDHDVERRRRQWRTGLPLRD